MYMEINVINSFPYNCRIELHIFLNNGALKENILCLSIIFVHIRNAQFEMYSVISIVLSQAQLHLTKFHICHCYN